MFLSWKCSNFDFKNNMGWYYSIPGDFTIEPAISPALAKGLYELRSRKHGGSIISFNFNLLQEHADKVFSKIIKWGDFGKNV